MNSLQSATLRHSAWFGDREYQLTFPENWNVSLWGPKPQKELSDQDIVSRLSETVRAASMSYNTRPGVISIATDDITRPTPTDRILPLLLNLLKQAGIPGDSLRVVTGGGTHACMGDDLLRVKLSDWICDHFVTSSHNPYKDGIRLGKTQNGTPIYINREVAKASFKISIGGVFPHALAGFGGGDKSVLGICGFGTIANLHYRFTGSRLGGETSNPFRNELAEIRTRVGMDASINVIIDETRKITEVFAGDFLAAHGAAVAYSRNIFEVPAPSDADLCIIDTYPFDTMFHFSKKAWWPSKFAPPNAMIVTLGGYPLGAGHHGLHPVLKGLSAKLKHKAYVMSWLPVSLTAKMLLNAIGNKINNRKLKLKPQRQTIHFRSHHGDHVPIAEFQLSWSDLTCHVQKSKGNGKLQASLYRCAPLLFPEEESWERSGLLESNAIASF